MPGSGNSVTNRSRLRSPASYATEAYFGVTAYRFINSQGQTRYGRYRIVPHAGVEHLDDATAKAKGENYLSEELAKRIASGAVRFDIEVQAANENDIVDDAAMHWPANRPVIQLGSFELTAIAPDDEEHRIIVDLIPRVDGIEPSADPLVELRAAIYLLSGRRRRQASEPRDWALQPL